MLTFNRYLYTLFDHYLSADSTVKQFLDVFGLSTEYDEKSTSCKPLALINKEYFRYSPKIQQWILVVVVFMQYQVHKLLMDEEAVKGYQEKVSVNFKARYPRIAHFWELIQHLKKEFLILLTFIVFFVIIIFSDKNIINWGF